MQEAPSAREALNQANKLWPNRRRDSDGICGDAAHRARKSDHNPGRAGYCHAVDITHDPRHGCSGRKIFAQLVKACREGTETRAKLVIHNRMSASAIGGWRVRRYRGVNPHKTHVHISIKDTSKACEDTHPWPFAGRSKPIRRRKTRYYRVTAEAGLNMRAGAARRFGVVHVLAHHDMVSATGARLPWMFVRHKHGDCKVSGWVASRYLARIGRP